MKSISELSDIASNAARELHLALAARKEHWAHIEIYFNNSTTQYSGSIFQVRTPEKFSIESMQKFLKTVQLFARDEAMKMK